MEISRAPIVVVLGHVDHGKTSLLDAVRKTNVTAREAGGITQKIGASEIKTKDGKKITFIDTPGHALFSAMRLRGAKYADIALLIVAGDDGVAPQTKEALTIIREEKIPFIVVITKTDLPTASTETALQQLEKEGVYFEKRGGDTSYIEVSAKTGKGIEDLLDLISLVSEVSDVKSDPEGELSATVLETSKDKKGLLVSVVVINGKLKVGDTVYAGKIEGKIKGLFNDLGKAVKELNPGEPGQILGFSELAPTGATIKSKPYEINENLSRTNGEKESRVKIYVKAKTAGGLEALIGNLPKGVYVVGSSVGDLNENDVFLAKAADASIFIFEAKTPSSVSKLADTEGVAIERFDIIYALIERLTDLVTSGETKILGRAQVVASFPFNGKKVAGCKVVEGVIKKQDRLELQRGESTIGSVRVTSIRKQKDEVNQVRQGEECGILFEPQLDFKVADMLLSVSKRP
ncbi:MAG TPA: translation initiation factor IF-2 [Patescibacteria group bacterium]